MYIHPIRSLHLIGQKSLITVQSAMPWWRVFSMTPKATSNGDAAHEADFSFAGSPVRHGGILRRFPTTMRRK